jgi:alpha-beta hydrolase superfamily lysophospholipase
MHEELFMKFISLIILILFCSESFCQERFVSVEGQKFRIKTFGVGEKTVLFESGLADSLEAWGSLPDTIAHSARVFLYDRADIGKSDTSRQERTLPNIASELENILKVAEIRPPYVIVAHSFGASIARYFSSQYPDQVKGLLLLDPTADAYFDHLSKEELKGYLEFVAKIQRSRQPRYRKEEDQTFPNLIYMKDLHIHHDLPVILVSVVQRKGDDYPKYQREIISGFSDAIQLTLEGTHYVHRDHPNLVIKCINDLLMK